MLPLRSNENANPFSVYLCISLKYFSLPNEDPQSLLCLPQWLQEESIRNLSPRVSSRPFRLWLKPVRTLSMLLAFTCFTQTPKLFIQSAYIQADKGNHFRSSVMNVHVGTGYLVKHNNHKQKASRCCLCLIPSLTEACWQPPLALCFFELGASGLCLVIPSSQDREYGDV